MAKSAIDIIINAKGGGKARGEIDDTAKSVTGLKSAVQTAATAMAAVGLTAFVTDFGVKSFQAAGQADVLARSADGLSASLGETAATMTDAVQRASLGTIDSITALEASNKAMMFGLVESSAQMGELTKMAVVLGAAMGQDAGKSIDDMTTALGRQSPLILDNLGITLSVEDANRKYAESIGKTVQALTDEEKKQAFVNEALAIGAQRVAELGGIQEGAVTSTQQLSAAWTDFQIAFGELLTGPGAGALEWVTAFITALENGANAWQGILVNGGIVFDAIGGMIDAAILKVREFFAQFGIDLPDIGAGELLDSVTNLVPGLQAAKVVAGGLAAPIVQAKNDMEATVAATQSLNSALARNEASGQRYAAYVSHVTGEMQTQAELTSRQANIERRLNDMRDQMAGGDSGAIDRANARLQAEEDAAAASVAAWESSQQQMYNNLRGMVESQLRPTLDEVWSGGGDDRRIDEWGRRAATIMTEGLNSEWLPALQEQFGGTDFWAPIQEAINAGDVGGAQNLLGDLLTNNPQALWDKELIKERVRQSIQQEGLRNDLINTIMSELSGEGLQVDAGQVEASMGGGLPMASPIASGLGDALPEAVSEAETGKKLINAIDTAIKESQDEMSLLAQTFVRGFEGYMSSELGMTARVFLESLTSYVAAALGVNNGAGVRQ